MQGGRAPGARRALSQAARALEQGAGDVDALLCNLDWDVLKAAKARAESKAKGVAAAKPRRGAPPSPPEAARRCAACEGGPGGGESCA